MIQILKGEKRCSVIMKSVLQPAIALLRRGEGGNKVHFRCFKASKRKVRTKIETTPIY